MAEAATIEKQSASAATVELNDMPDIMAEQASLAAGLKGVEEAVQQPATKVEAEIEKPYVAPVESDLDDDLADQFAAQKNRVAPHKDPVTPKAAKTETGKIVIGAVDHADIDEELRPVFRQMSNAAIEKLKPLILAAKKDKEQLTALETQLTEAKKGTLPDSYYEHDMGYVLTPEFSQRSATVDTASSIHNHWREQLNAVRSGADTYTPLMNDKDGNVVKGQPVNVDKDTLGQLEDIRTWAQQQYNTEKSKLDNLAETHRSKSAGLKTWLNDFQAKAFPTFETNGNLKSLIPDTIKQFPAPFHSNPLTPLLARAFITIAELGEQLKAGKVVPAAATNKQPSAAVIAGGGAGKAATLNDDSDIAGAFERAKKGLL
jgi:uncharacterized membrane protein YkoI